MNTALHQRTSAAIGRVGGAVLRNRRLMRLPIWLYRGRLGFLFGRRMLLLEHVGRRTGARRHVVLEVVGHPGPDTYVVASGFGRRAQWFRNLAVEPRARVWVGGHGPRSAVARELSTEEADRVLAAYLARHRRAWDALKPVLENTLGSGIDEQGTQLPMLELRLTA